MAHILIVDDVEEILETMSPVLQEAGYDVSVCSCASVALSLMQEKQYDIVITDVLIPEMNGYEFAMQAKTTPLHKSVLISVGSFLKKSFSPAELLRSVDMLLPDVQNGAERCNV